MTPAAIRAVIFDMDGVLTDSEPLINAAAVAAFRELGLVVQPADFHPFIGTGENRYLGGVAERYHFPIDIPAAKRRTYEIYLELVPRELRAFPGAVELVRVCRRAGLKTAVASSADRIKIDANLNRIGLPPSEWDAIVTGDDVEHKKPAPDIFLAAARRLGLAAGECVVVEDAVNGVQAAKAAAMRCVAVAQSFPPAQLAAADCVLKTIREVRLEDLLADPSADRGAGGADQHAGHDGGRAAGRPWGFWATVGAAAIIEAVSTGMQALAAIGLVVAAQLLGSRALMDADSLVGDGVFWWLSIWSSAPVTVGLVWAFVWLRRGPGVREYLALQPVTLRQLRFWGIVLLAFMCAGDGLTAWVGRPIVPDVLLEAYRTSVVPPLLWLALLAGAPVAEELFFRGFLFQGFQHSRVGPTGAVLLTSALWAALHQQYDWWGITVIFACGILIGTARWRTGSLYPCLLMHCLMNFVATVQVIVLLNVQER